jgi:hypothetical protein
MIKAEKDKEAERLQKLVLDEQMNILGDIRD